MIPHQLVDQLQLDYLKILPKLLGGNNKIITNNTQIVRTLVYCMSLQIKNEQSALWEGLWSTEAETNTFIEERKALTVEDHCALKAAGRLRSLVLDSFLVAIHASRTCEGHSCIRSAVDIFV